MNTAQQNKAIVKQLILEALVDNDVTTVKQLVAADAVTHRAGFASLYRATGDAIPQDGNFMDWVRDGWDVLHAALGDQRVTVVDIVADDRQVMAHFHYNVLHQGTFTQMPATNKRIEWDEIGIFKFNDQGKIQEMWYMIDELRVAQELGHRLDQTVTPTAD
ncbi:MULTISPECIES: ester cyclase [Lactobacillaceae]|uniref:ester cyclase n=1 Tax=Lactobacillaceae TaxID=33958 RepID=UPI0014571139|nr:ester cyclase [Lactobacillus sp. HBUAS51381]NLR10350.1 ester cyclase [Lactobacillus sp. HBUAS51381]